MKYFIVTLFISIQSGAFGQFITGRVVDRKTSEGLAYASIHVAGKNLGVISDKDGEFAIDVSGTQKSDTLRITYVGYETFSSLLEKMDFSAKQIIRLNAKSIELNEITVSAKNVFQRLGNQTIDHKYTGWGDFKSHKGRTKGLLIEGKNYPVKVKSLLFKIDYNEWDSVAFRVNFLKVNDDRSTQSILQENIFIVTTKKHKWVKVDLGNHNIILFDKVIAAIEWVDAWGKTGQYSNLLTLYLSKNSGYTFNQEVGQEFGSLSFEKNSPAIFLEVYGD